MGLSFVDRISQYGGRCALITETGQMSYSELDLLAKEIACAVSAKSLVFCVCRNQLAAVAGYVGFLQKRVVPLMVSGSIDAELYRHLEQVYTPGFVWCPEEFPGDRRGRIPVWGIPSSENRQRVSCYGAGVGVAANHLGEYGKPQVCPAELPESRGQYGVDCGVFGNHGEGTRHYHLAAQLHLWLIHFAKSSLRRCVADSDRTHYF